MTDYKSEWIEEDRERVKFLEALYIADKRDSVDHPMHGLYTGLYQQYLKEQKQCKKPSS